MGMSDLIGRKVRGKDSVFVIRLEDPLPYPEQDLRWEEYGNPLCALAYGYFEELGVEYFRNQNEMMDQINLVCYRSKLRYKKCEEGEVIAGLFRAISNGVEEFFRKKNTTAIVENVWTPSATLFQEYLAASIGAKLNAECESAAIQTASQSKEPSAVKGPSKTSKPAVIVSPETGRPDLVVPLDKAIDVSDIDTNEGTISRSDDGRYLFGFISKQDGNRYYIEMPQELVDEIMRARER